MVILVILGYSILVLFEFRPLYRRKNWRDFWVNTVIGLFSFVIAVLLSLRVKIPSPVKPLGEFITTLLGK